MDPLGNHAPCQPRPRWGRGFAWLTALAMLLPALAFAAADPDGTRSLRMGGDAAYPPYHFIDGDGQANGFDVALAGEVARDLGMQPRFELGEWSGALDALARGENDIVPMFWSAARERRFLFTQPILIRHHALFGPRDRPRLRSLDELESQRVAVQRAGLAWEALREQG